MKKKIYPFIMAIVILQLMFAGIAGVYAWVEGASKVAIETSNLQLASSPGLVMKIGGVSTEIVDLNKYCQNNKDATLILAEASSADGKTIYFRDHADANIDETETIYLRDQNEADKNVNYIYLVFTLTADSERPIKIWFDNDADNGYYSQIRNNTGGYVDAVRVSFEIFDANDKGEVAEGSISKTIIMSDIDTEKITVEKRGVFDYDRTNKKLVEGEDKIHSMDIRSLKMVNKDNPLITLEAKQTKKIVMRVWLEGLDEKCIDQVAGESLLMQLYFASETVE